MASKPPDSKDPKKMTSRSKRFSGRITLWRNAMQLRHNIAQASQALDNIFSELFEEDVVSEMVPTTPVPIEQPPFAEQDGDRGAITVHADADRPSKRPTHLYPAVKAKTVVEHFIRMWADANSPLKKEQVREIVNKGLTNHIISQADYDELQKHFV